MSDQFQLQITPISQGIVDYDLKVGPVMNLVNHGPVPQIEQPNNIPTTDPSTKAYFKDTTYPQHPICPGHITTMK